MQRGKAAAPPANGGLLRYFKPLRAEPVSAEATSTPVALEAAKSAPQGTRDGGKTNVDVDDGKLARHVNAAAETPTSEEQGVSEYERKRLARMAQNAQFLLQLGVKQAQQNVLSGVSRAKLLTAKPSKAAKRAREGGDGSPPVVRRSRRLAGEKEEVETNRKRLEESGESDEEDEKEPEYEDSSVFRYTCSRVDGGSSSETMAGDRSLVGFRAGSAETYEDPALKKIYAITFSPFQENALIVTGGHQGHVSVYPSVRPERHGDETTAPLMSYRAHRGWISCLSLARSSSKGKNLLLSAANDGVVKLWDLNQSTGGTPKELLVSTELHQSGIFGMDVVGDHVVTCSKDSTIALSLFIEGAEELHVQRRYEDHAGVVKSVRFSAVQPSYFASGGNDRVVRVYDVRENEARASQEIYNAHERVINSVTWHPTQEHLLLTAGFDPDMHLYDLRQPAKPLVVMNNSRSPAGSGQSIFHPCFVLGGQFVVSTGATSQDKLSLHQTANGTPISVGSLPAKASFLAVDPFADRLLIAMGPLLQPYDFEWKPTVV